MVSPAAPTEQSYVDQRVSPTAQTENLKNQSGVQRVNVPSEHPVAEYLKKKNMNYY